MATLLLVLSVASLPGCPVAPPLEEDAGVVLDPPFAARAGHFEVRRDGRLQPFFVRGVNIGLGVPGAIPDDFAVSPEQFARWLGQIHGLGIDVIRMPILFPPALYRELLRFNEAHADAPMYLFQGVYLRDVDAERGLDLHLSTEWLDRAIEDTVAGVHGALTVEPREHAAWGTFDADVSPWVVGYIVGREILSEEVLETDAAHDEVSFSGANLAIEDATPSEVWALARLQHLVGFERARFDTARPVGFLSWSELDPLHHPTEVEGSDTDRASLDLSRASLVDHPPGLFVPFDAYPYYPHFVNDDPGYRAVSDEAGRNAYLGYLQALVAHHGDVPLLLAELGVPSSWGRTKNGFSGMHHGGHDEREQGEIAVRLFGALATAGTAGGLWFQWADGWFKRVWITSPTTFPRERLPLWHDVMTPEQSYGLLAFDSAPPEDALDVAYEDGIVRRVRGSSDAAFVHVALTLNDALGEGERIVLAFDTYADDLGESILPDGSTSPARVELALEIRIADGAVHAQMLTTEGYALYQTVAGETLATLRRSSATDGAAWREIWWLLSRPRVSADGTSSFPEERHPVGLLRARREGEAPSTLDAVVIDGAEIRARIPWTLLSFSDPSSGSVVHDAPETMGLDARPSEGVRFVVSVRGEVRATERMPLGHWDAVDDASGPRPTERLKVSADILAEGLLGVPHWMERDD
jgi:hypothetical protein